MHALTYLCLLRNDRFILSFFHQLKIFFVHFLILLGVASDAFVFVAQ